MKLQYEDKVTFVIAFTSVVLAVAPFKDALNKIIFDFGFISCSLLLLFYISFGFLVLSVYFYALDYTRYGFKFLDRLSLLFKGMQILANTFYFVAIFSPFIYFIIWLAVKILKAIPYFNIQLPQISNYLSLIISVLVAGISTFVSWRQYKYSHVAQEEQLEQSASTASTIALNLVEKRKWNLAIIEAYRSLELSITKKLIESGIDAERIPFYRLTKILLDLGVFTKEDFNNLIFIRELRNKAVHSSEEFGEEQALSVIKLINEILPKLETRSTSSSLLEQDIIKVLLGKNGLFLRHHIRFTNTTQDFGCDAIAEGPGHNYFIEIKALNNPTILKKVLEQLNNSCGKNSRKIIIVLKSTEIIDLNDENVKILYYDPEKREFVNRDELFNWIYKKA
jgi:HEPN domain-containing protein